MTLKATRVPGGSNSVTTSAQDLNEFTGDILTAGIVGVITSPSGDNPDTGGLAVVESGTPSTTITVKAGTVYITATPTSGSAQRFRLNVSADESDVLDLSGKTTSKWYLIYATLDADDLVNPPSDNSWTNTDILKVTSTGRDDSATALADLPANSYPLATINYDGTIQDTDITDQRDTIDFGSALAPVIWTAHSPTFTGFATDPTGFTSRYCQIGKLIYWNYSWGTVGASNATTFTMTLPVAAGANAETKQLIMAYNNSTAQAAPGSIVIANDGTIATLNKATSGADGWTASNNKDARFLVIYEID